MARVLFIQNFWFEYLGTMILSSLLKQHGHSVDLVISNNPDTIVEYINDNPVDIVGAYTISGSHTWVTDVFETIKSVSEALTLAGGPHPTFFPEFVLEPSVDAVCVGEGEGAILDIAECITQGNDIKDVKNVYTKSNGQIRSNPLRPLLENLDSLPYPDRDLYYDKYPILGNSPSKHFITGRGCPFNCRFCSNKAYKNLYCGLGRMVRRPNPQKICDEINDARSKHPLQSVRFDDEVFLMDEVWLLDFLDRYKKEVGLPFSCLIRADIATPKSIAAMKSAGCYIAYFGIESGNDYIRNQILGKNITRTQIIETARLLRKHRIKIGTFNMVGMPGETFENAWETVRLNQLIRSDYPWCSIIQPYPGTELEQMARKMGVLDSDYGVNSLNQSYFNDTVLKNPDAEQLVVLQKLFYLAVRFPEMERLVRWAAKRGSCNLLIQHLFNLTYAWRYSKTYKMPLGELLKRALLWKDSY